MSIQFNETAAVHSPAWKQHMSAYGETLKNQKVRQVFLVHGTFAGNNALGLYDIFEPVERSLTGSTHIIDKLKSLGKDLFNQLGDVGNYTPEYAANLERGLNASIPCELFVWGSGNFHLARLKGAIDLARKLAETVSTRSMQSTERLLLLGHSHAGQLFALLTTLLENGETAEQLYEVIEQSRQLGTKADLLRDLSTLKPIGLDMVTFGTPVRYAWGRYENYRLLAIVNHRSPVDFTGLLTTRDGDYVQQWGAEGTDLPATFEFSLNDSLDTVLDKGRDSTLFIQGLTNQERKNPHFVDGSTRTETLLIDYKDNADSILEFLDVAHCVKTLFGHGVYTENRAMLFNVQALVEKLYH